MADIDVVKKSSNTWLWIVVLIIAIAAIVWFMNSRGTAHHTGQRLTPAAVGVTAALAVGGARAAA